MPSKKTFTDNQYQGYTLSDNSYTFNKDLIEKEIELIETMCSRHSKVLVTRLDLRFPTEYESDGSNKVFSATMHDFCRDYARKKCDPQYIAKREQVSSQNPHYHQAIVVNGNKLMSADGIRRTQEKHYANQLEIPLEEVRKNELVYPCNKAPDGSPRENSRMIDRNKDDAEELKAKTIKQISYQAKVDKNDRTASSTKKVFTSQYRKKISQRSNHDQDHELESIQNTPTDCEGKQSEHK